MLVKFNKKSNYYLEDSLGLVIYDAHKAMPLVRGACKLYDRLVNQDMWAHKSTFTKVPHTKANLRAYDKQIKNLPRASNNCTPEFVYS